MKIAPRQFRAAEIVRLLNLSPLGKVVQPYVVYRPCPRCVCCGLRLRTGLVLRTGGLQSAAGAVTPRKRSENTVNSGLFYGR